MQNGELLNSTHGWKRNSLFRVALKKQLQGNITVFYNHIFLRNRPDISVFNSLIDFCTPGYHFYLLYDSNQWSVYIIPFTAAFISQTLHGYTSLYKYVYVPDVILCHDPVGRDTHLGRPYFCGSCQCFCHCSAAKNLVPNFDVFSFFCNGRSPGGPETMAACSCADDS